MHQEPTALILHQFGKVLSQMEGLPLYSCYSDIDEPTNLYLLKLHIELDAVIKNPYRIRCVNGLKCIQKFHASLDPDGKSIAIQDRPRTRPNDTHDAFKLH